MMLNLAVNYQQRIVWKYKTHKLRAYFMIGSGELDAIGTG